MASKSGSSTSSQTTSSTTSNVTQIDQRQGVEGSNNIIASGGATLNVTSQDVSADLAKKALDTSEAALVEQSRTAGAALTAMGALGDAAITGNSRVASDALAKQVEAQANALRSVDSAVARSTDLAGAALVSSERAVNTVASTLGAAAHDQSSFLSEIVRTIGDQTEQTRLGNQQLASQAIDKAITGISDSRRDTNETILTNAFKYGALAVIGIGVALALFTRSRSK